MTVGTLAVGHSVARGGGFHLAYDTVGGSILDASFHDARRFGHVVSICARLRALWARETFDRNLTSHILNLPRSTPPLSEWRVARPLARWTPCLDIAYPTIAFRRRLPCSKKPPLSSVRPALTLALAQLCTGDRA
jgi:hypothetical protein